AYRVPTKFFTSICCKCWFPSIRVFAIFSSLALETCRSHWRGSTKTVALVKNGKIPTLSIEHVQANSVKELPKWLF
ncbi:hypothetical protein KC19_3G128100, partial [Ceratodon purpureus]